MGKVSFSYPFWLLDPVGNCFVNKVEVLALRTGLRQVNCMNMKQIWWRVTPSALFDWPKEPAELHSSFWIRWRRSLIW